MVLTPRDIIFLKDLTQVRFLNTKRIYRLYNTEVNCRVRLKAMVNEGYISHPIMTDKKEYVYCPTAKTYKMMECKTSKVYPNDKLNHYLACADFYFYIKDQLESFNLETQYYFTHNNKKYSFRPDIVIESKGKSILVEIDLSNRRFESKIDMWESFYTSGIYKEHFEKYPPILIVSTNVDKVKSVINKNKKIDLNYIYKDYNEVKEWKYNYDLVLSGLEKL